MLLLELKQQVYIKKYFFKNEILPKQQQNYSEEIHQLPFLNLNSLINHKNFQNFLEWKKYKKSI